MLVLPDTFHENSLAGSHVQFQVTVVSQESKKVVSNQSKDGLDKRTEMVSTKQKQKILRKGGKNTQKNCTKKSFTTKIMTMV